MVSHSVRSTGDDKCSDLTQSVKCFEELICAAKAQSSNYEIETYIRQAFEAESPMERLRELSDVCSDTTGFIFCMTSFCAYICDAFETLGES